MQLSQCHGTSCPVFRLLNLFLIRRMLLLESLESKLLRCKLLEHLLDYACPQKITLPMSLSLLLHFLKNCTLAPDPTVNIRLEHFCLRILIFVTRLEVLRCNCHFSFNGREFIILFEQNIPDLLTLFSVEM